MPNDGLVAGPPGDAMSNPVVIPVLERTTTWTRKPWMSCRTTRSPLQELWETRAYRLFVIYCIYLLGLCLLFPYIPTLETNFFASQRAGKPVTCTGLAQGHKPPEVCVEAHSDVTTWNTWQAFITNGVLALYLNPAFGTWSDLYGRRPFIAFGILLGVFPHIALLLYIWKGLPLYWYYPAHIISGSVSSYTVSLGFLGDVISFENRSVVFGFYTGTFYVPSILASLMTIVQIVKDPSTAIMIGLATTALALVLVFTWLPESLPERTRQLARQKALEFGAAGGQGCFSSLRRAIMSALQSLRILMRTSMFMKLTVTVMLVMMVFQEQMNLQFQYLQEVAGFETRDQAISMFIYGCGGLLTNFVLLWLLLTVFGLSEKWALLIGLVANTFEDLVLAVTKTKSEAFAAMSIGTVGGLVFPAIQAIKSKSVGEDEQGAVQGALVGARSFAGGVGPFFFLIFFLGFRNSKLYFPGAPFVAAAVFEFLALIIASTIQLPDSFTKSSFKKRNQVSKQLSYTDDVEGAIPLLTEDS